MVQVMAIARAAYDAILDGGNPNGIQLTELGKYGECYSEMVRAHEQGGTGAARQMYISYAEVDPDIAALRAASPEPPKTGWTARELLAAEFPPPVYVVDGLLPAGKADLAGRPKLGKSWLGLQTAVAVSTGGVVLGRTVEAAPVLYLALEDNPRRLQDRLRKQHAQPTDDLHLHTEWPLFGRDGIPQLLTTVDRYGCRLIVIDTISRALGGADQMDAGEMNVMMGSLQRFAIDRQVCVLCIDHHRKSAGFSGDPIDDILGATSKAGVSDAVMGLYRERGKRDATLKVVGRDIDDQELAIQFDPITGCWQLVGTADGVRAESVQADLLMALKELGGEATTTAIARFLNMPPPNVSRELGELVAKGKVQRIDKPGKEVPYRLIA